MRNQKPEVEDLKDLVKSSITDIENFKNSLIWQDILRILEDWDTGLKNDYDKAENMEEVKRIQGVSVCIEYVKNLPEAMKSIVLMEVENNES